jgi:hypothetical protein
MNYPKKYCIQGCGENDDGGAFRIPFKNYQIFVIASHGGDWNHVSVSLADRCPSWEEMCYVKDLFFNPEDCVIQYHPPKSNYVNNNPYVLHLWQPQNEKIPMPPVIFV